METLHETHPGFTSRNCPHQYNVSRCEQNGRGGYGCGLTGGHCLPRKECVELSKDDQLDSEEM